MGASQNYNVNLNINANAQSAEKQLQKLQSQLQQISNMDLKFDGSKISDEIREASEAALELQSHLKAATNASTGNLDFTKLNASLKQSSISLDEYGRKLINLGPQGQKAFMDLSTAISKSEIPLKRTSKVLNGVFDNYWELERKDIFDISQRLQDLTKDANIIEILDSIQSYISWVLKNNPIQTQLINHIKIIEDSKKQAKLGIRPQNIFDDLCLKLINQPRDNEMLVMPTFLALSIALTIAPCSESSSA